MVVAQNKMKTSDMAVGGVGSTQQHAREMSAPPRKAPARRPARSRHWWNPFAKGPTPPPRVIPPRQPIIPAGQLSFICDICGHAAEAPLEQVAQRETITCRCGSTLRFRAVTAALQERLFGKVQPLAQLPQHKEIKGLGMSETGVYCHLLNQKFEYVNTFLDRPPMLDIMDPAPEYLERFDFVICSDVMEHVPQPVALAFANLRRLLRPGGTLVFTVPYSFGDGVHEHFPDLCSYELRGTGADTYLVNTNSDGEETIYRDLHFHGGHGSTLEMRLFSLGGVIELLGEAGFRETKIHDGHLPYWGVVNLDLTSHPITALA
jgi:SAM-dependent methyltransferase